MWTDAGPGRWSRDGGYLLSDGDLMLELHGNIVHLYRRGKADPRFFSGGPLDGYVWLSTTTTVTPAVGAPTVDAPTAWRLLGDRAARIDAVSPRRGDSKTPSISKPN